MFGAINLIRQETSGHAFDGGVLGFDRAKSNRVDSTSATM
jgi:hypothetical protein